MIPGFVSAEAAYEAQLPPDMDEDCTDDCGECQECLAIAAEDEAEALAESQWEEDRLERRYGA